MQTKIRGKLLVTTIVYMSIVSLIELAILYCLFSGLDILYARILAALLSLLLTYYILRALLRAGMRKQGEKDDWERFGGRS